MAVFSSLNDERFVDYFNIKLAVRVGREPETAWVRNLYACVSLCFWCWYKTVLVYMSPCDRVSVEMLIFSHRMKAFLAFYGTWQFIAVIFD
jgi:hypothetical protein